MNPIIGTPILNVNRNADLFFNDNIGMSIGSRIREARKNAKLSQKELALKVGVKQSTISELETGESAGTTLLASFASALGVNALWLETGKGSPSQNTPQLKFEKVKIADPENQNLLPIRTVKLRLSAGISGFVLDQQQDDGEPIFFRRSWFEKRGFDPERLVAVKVKGESMDPTLRDGDTIVINTADAKPQDGEIFAVNYEGEAVVKRMVRDIGQWWLSSDNQDQRKYHRKVCQGDACIVIGKVIHRQTEWI